VLKPKGICKPNVLMALMAQNTKITTVKIGRISEDFLSGNPKKSSKILEGFFLT
jgi:hypothetical protein